jgi:hypothetical protein
LQTGIGYFWGGLDSIGCCRIGKQYLQKWQQSRDTYYDKERHQNVANDGQCKQAFVWQVIS